MEPSTRKIEIDVENLIQRDTSYVTTLNDFGDFIAAETPDKLETEYFKDKDGSKVEFFVSTSDDMVSEDIKVLMPISDKFYHFFIDSLTTLLKIHKQHPGVIFVLYINRSKPNPSYEDFLVLLFKVLDFMNVRYKVISTVPGMDFAPTYKFNNYVLIDSRINVHEMVTFIDVRYAIDLAIKSAVDESEDVVVPFRKVYLTRGGKGADIGPVADDYEFYRDDLRIYEEEKLEKFFSDLGYEIVEPETEFESIAHQIRYMREVKALVSATSSGLANMMFMQNNQTVIEIQVEIVQVFDNTIPVVPVQSLHNYYQPLSFMGGHLHISIPSDRHPDKVIEVLTKDALSYIL